MNPRCDGREAIPDRTQQAGQIQGASEAVAISRDPKSEFLLKRKTAKKKECKGDYFITNWYLFCR